MNKYYYLDENGNKKNYMGKIINDHITNETYGLLTQQSVSEQEVELEFHPQIDKEEGYNSYFTYKDSLGNNIKFNGLEKNIKINPIDNSYFFTIVNKSVINLIKHDKVDYQPGYFTYINQFGKEVKYNGKTFFDKFTNTYYFYC